MELLAPAGNEDCLAAAVDAGADAVYLGLQEQNARLRARNFTLAALARLVPATRRQGVRVYVVQNTLLKEAELERAIGLLGEIARIGVDAVIVADLGLLRLARRDFPALELHGSTQMLFHDRPGLEVARRLGLRRVILARELRLAEIAKLASGAPVELEVFAHGALCFSLSGLCLASSYFGGQSGNRGRCTQVCRRSYDTAGGRKACFSLMDLCALELVPKLQELGLAALKIEGRMKSAAYVSRVVSLYRRALDGEEPGALVPLAMRDGGRDKTAFFLGGDGPFVSSRPFGGTGVYLGLIVSVLADGFVLETSEEVQEGDRLRIHPKSGFEGSRARVLEVRRQDGRLHLRIFGGAEVEPGAGVYRIEHSPSAERRAEERDRRVPGRRRSRPLREEVVLGPRLWLRCDQPAWLDLVRPDDADLLLLGFSRSDFARLDPAALAPWQGRVALALPAFVPPEETDELRRSIRQLQEAGFHRFLCGNIGQRALFDAPAALAADWPIWCLNTESQAALRDLGFAFFVRSLEEDFPGFLSSPSQRGVVPVYARVPLFIARARPACPGPYRDALGRTFELVEREGLFIAVGSAPLGLTHRRAKLEKAGVQRFLIDLSFEAPGRDLLDRVLGAQKRGEKIPGTVEFNFKLGLH